MYIHHMLTLLFLFLCYLGLNLGFSVFEGSAVILTLTYSLAVCILTFFSKRKKEKEKLGLKIHEKQHILIYKSGPTFLHLIPKSAPCIMLPHVLWSSSIWHALFSS